MSDARPACANSLRRRRTLRVALVAVVSLTMVGCSTDLQSTAPTAPVSPTGSTTGTTPVAASIAPITTSITAPVSTPGIPSTQAGASTTTTPPDCAATVREAAFAIEIEEQVKLLDVALTNCGTVQQLTTEIDKFPGFTGYSTPYLIVNRCERVEDETIRNGAVCTAAVPSTTLPLTATNDIVYVGKTLDGRQVELRPTPELPFIDDAPAEIKNTVDVAIADGCDGVFKRRNFWYNAFNNGGGDAASVFAQHAVNMAQFLNCGSRPLPSAGDDESSTTGN